MYHFQRLILLIQILLQDCSIQCHVDIILVHQFLGASVLFVFVFRR